MNLMLRILLALAFFAPLAAMAQQDASFVPLTNVPILYEVGTAFNLESYLNTLYRILIGAAAVIAVLKIMLEGIKYMGGDSVTEKKDAKNNIAMALGGLVLVLSPVVVFSIINPDILSLRLDTSNLKPEETSFTKTGQVLSITEDTQRSRAESRRACELSKGIAKFSCVSGQTNVGREVPQAETCKSGERSFTVCTSSSSAITTVQACTREYTNITSAPIKKGGVSQLCSATSGLESIPIACCAGITENAICCGKPKGATGVSATGTQGPSTVQPKPGTTQPNPTVSQPTRSANKFAWNARYYVDPNCTSSGCQTVTERGGPFNTQQECYDSSASVPAKNKRAGLVDPPGFLCSCAKPISDPSQRQCPS